MTALAGRQRITATAGDAPAPGYRLTYQQNECLYRPCVGKRRRRQSAGIGDQRFRCDGFDDRIRREPDGCPFGAECRRECLPVFERSPRNSRAVPPAADRDARPCRPSPARVRRIAGHPHRLPEPDRGGGSHAAAPACAEAGWRRLSYRILPLVAHGFADPRSAGAVGRTQPVRQ